MVESEDFRTCAATGLPRSVLDLRRMVQYRTDPAHTGHGSWHQQDHHLGHHHIEKDPDGILGDSSNVAHLHGTGSNLIAAKIQDGNDRQVNDHRSQTVQACEQTIGLDGGDGVVFERFPHPFYFMGLFAERPDHPHAGQIFPQDHIHPVQKTLEQFKNAGGLPDNEKGGGQHQEGGSQDEKAHIPVNGKGKENAKVPKVSKSVVEKDRVLS